jgi:hypothetical protein
LAAATLRLCLRVLDARACSSSARSHVLLSKNSLILKISDHSEMRSLVLKNRPNSSAIFLNVTREAQTAQARTQRKLRSIAAAARRMTAEKINR